MLFGMSFSRVVIMVTQPCSESFDENNFIGDSCEVSAARRQRKKAFTDKPDAVFTRRDNDSVKEFSNLASGNTSVSSHCFKSNKMDSIGSEFCANNPIIGEENTMVEGNSYSCPLGQISQAEDDHSFYGNNHEDKIYSDLLEYTWPEIGNFEDVDRMFRSCDSTFGIGTSNEDEFDWFSSPIVNEASGDASRSDVKLLSSAPNALENIPAKDGALSLIEASDSPYDFGMKSQSASYTGSLWASEKSENNGRMPISPKDSYMLDQMQSMPSSPDLSFKVVPITPNPKTLENKLPSGVKLKNHNDTNETNMGVPMELGSLMLQDISSTSSGLDEVSEEAASFHQLQHVMKQLDLRTKLCIRDGLYRLAQSAGRRHRNANLNGAVGDDIDASRVLIDEGTHMSIGFTETDTNPIDRSIAHLLFHRSTESPAVPAHESSFKSSSMIPGSNTSFPVVAERLISVGETAAEKDTDAAADHEMCRRIFRLCLAHPTEKLTVRS